MIQKFLIAVILLLLSSLSLDIVGEYDNIEGFRGRRGHHNKKRHRMRGRHSRPSHWRRGPKTRLYDSNDYYWGGRRQIHYPRVYDYFPSWFYTARCREGCAHTGNGTVGCVNPTNTPESCIFASHCYGC